MTAVTVTITLIAKTIPIPSKDPCKNPCYEIPIIRDAAAAAHKIYKVLSSNYSVTKSHIDVGSYSSGILSPNLFKYLYNHLLFSSTI